MNNSTNKEFERPGFSESIAASKTVQCLEIAIVFSPVLIVILGFRLLDLSDPVLRIAGVWAAYVLMLVLISLSIFLRGDTWQTIGLSLERGKLSDVLRTVLKSLGVLIFAVAGFIVGTIVMANIVGIPEGADLSKYNYLKGNLPLLLISLAGVYFVSSFAEEVVFRGFLITRAEVLFGGKTRAALIGALLLSSIVFGLAHFEWGVTGIVQTACMGAALGVCFVLTKRNLWPLILAHGYLDTLLLVQLYAA